MSETFKTLYGLDKSGKIRTWNVTLTKYDNYTEIKVSHGVLHGKIINSITKIDKGKNIGKKNETTHYSQAQLEAHSKWNKKKDIEHYVTDISSLNNPSSTPTHETDVYKIETITDSMEILNISSCKQLHTSTDNIEASTGHAGKPSAMLAHDHKKYKHKIQYPCYIQRKYDGYRLLYQHVTKDMFTRNGKKYDILYNSSLYQQLQKVTLPLDGELYCHGDFNFECYGVLRKKKITESDLVLLNKIEYHVYDVRLPNVPFSERLEILQQFFKEHSNELPKIKLVTTYTCKNEDEVNNYHTSFINDNYEGSIIRNASGLYESKRSFQLLKYKDFDDEEFVITDFTSEKDNDIHLVIWICKTNENKTFNIRPQGTKEEREKLFKNAHTFIGQKLWVKFFGYTDNKIPRFPSTKTQSYTSYIRNVVN